MALLFFLPIAAARLSIVVRQKTFYGQAHRKT